MICRLPWPALALLLAGLSIAGGCGRPAAPPNDPATPAAAPAATPAPTPVAAAATTVRLQLNWFPESEHGGYYHAQLKGHYRAAGLEVTLLPGGPNTPVESQLISGRCEFGILNADKVLQTRAEGAPLVALLAPFQTFPRCIIVHDASPVKALADLKNLTLIANQSLPFVMFLRHRFGLEGVDILPYKGGLALFTTMPTAAVQGYITSEPLILEQQGFKVRSLLVADAGFNPYTSVLVVTTTTLRERPGVVRAMVQASQRGWREYLAAPAGANAAIRQQNPEIAAAVLDYGAAHLKDLMLVGEAKERFGVMTAARWEELQQQLLDCGAMRPGGPPAKDAFTTEFLAP